MIFFDTEDDSKGNLLLVNFFDGYRHNTLDIKNYDDQFILKRKAIEYILNNPEKKFFAHNLEYDLVNIFYPYSLRLIELFYSGRLIYAKLKGTHKKFYDSFNFSFTSLENIGSEIGLKKIDIKGNYYNVEYCRRDCEIGYFFIKNFEGKVFNDFELPIKATLAGTSQNIFLKKFNTHNINNINKSEKILSAYFGGRCEVFKIGEIIDNVFAVDVNSMYPYVMKNFKYPISKLFCTKEPVTDFFISRVKLKIKKNTDIPIIPCRDKLLFFPVGNFETWTNNIELNEAIKIKQVEKIEYLETYNFLETDFLFSGFIDFFYNERLKAKIKKNEFESNFYKRIMNSLYGRFALNSPAQIITSEPDKNGFHEILQNDMYSIEKHFRKNNINYALPLFVTAYSRVILFNLIQKVKSIGGEIIYTDTDSVYFHFFKKIDLHSKILEIYSKLPVSNNLGDLSLEVFKSGSFQGAKNYLLEEYSESKKIKLKGIPKNNREEFFKNGRTVYKRPLKLRPSLRGVQGIPANFWIDFVIESRKEYKKRELKNKNYKYFTETLPLEFNQGVFKNEK